jgi:Cu(I)/Ag(I) efflux system membrane fusion protein
MNAKLAAASAAVAIAAVALGAYHYGMNRGMAMVAPAPAPIAEPGDRKVLYWHDPMVPGHRFDKPGKSPFMDMQLVPVYADESQGPGVTVSPAMTQNLGVRTAVVGKGPAAAAVEAVGTVVQNERATVVVQSRVVGYVEKLFVRAVLDPVARGQPLATIFAPDWSGALTEYLGLRSANLDPALVSAARERLRLLSIPDDVVARSEREGAAQSRFTLTSPIAGVVGELGTREGAMVQPGMALFRIVDLSSVWVEASIPETQAAQLRVGAAAEVNAEAYPGRSFAGKVGAILPQVDATTRTLRARIELRNPGTVLKPGMFVNVSLRSGEKGDVLLVPQEAVIATGKRTVVIVAGDDNRFVPVEVTLGHPAGSAVEVRTGLAEGQRVVTSGQFLIDSEASLKSTLSRLEAVTSATAPGTYRSEGRVERIGKDELTLSHEPIPALKWPSMTMGFRNPPAGLPSGLKVGDRVRFEFVERQGTYQLTNVERIPGSKP